MKMRFLQSRAAQLLAFLALILVTASCKYIPNPVIPLPRSSAPAQPQGLTQGHWEGDGPSVSFDVTADGQIHNFRLVGSMPMGRCTITIDEIDVGEMGRFEFGPPDNSPFRITGALTGPKMFEGTYNIKVCRGAGDQVSAVMNPEEKTWKAEWKGNENQATTASSARPATAWIVTPRIVTDSRTSTPPKTPTLVATTTPSTAPPKAGPTAVRTTLTQASIPSGSWQRITTLPHQINSFALDLSNPQVVYAGTGQSGSGSGVYKSEDLGMTWRNASKGLPNEDVTALAFSRMAPFTLYAMVGVRGDLYASSDRAGSWTRIGNSGMTGGFWHRLVTAPDHTNILFGLALGSGMARSSDGGHTWTPIRRGIPSDQNSVHVQSLVIDPTNANVMYLGTGGHVGGGAGVFKSTDGGTTWSAANQGMLDGRIAALALDPKRPQTVYAGSSTGEFFRSSNGAQTWEDLTDNLPFRRGQHIGIRQILINPNAPQTIYLLCDQVGMVMSGDGGATWISFRKPPEGDSYYVHGAATVLFGDKPVVLLGDERSGAWRYAGE